MDVSATNSRATPVAIIREVTPACREQIDTVARHALEIPASTHVGTVPSSPKTVVRTGFGSSGSPFTKPLSTDAPPPPFSLTPSGDNAHLPHPPSEADLAALTTSPSPCEFITEGHDASRPHSTFPHTFALVPPLPSTFVRNSMDVRPLARPASAPLPSTESKHQKLVFNLRTTWKSLSNRHKCWAIATLSRVLNTRFERQESLTDWESIAVEVQILFLAHRITAQLSGDQVRSWTKRKTFYSMLRKETPPWASLFQKK